MRFTAPSLMAYMIDAVADRGILYGAAEHSHLKGILPPQPAPQPYPCLECELARKADLHSHTGGMDRW